ncbi:ATP-dependent zinc protease family protein [Shewanella gelidii]|uniref:Ribosomal protein S6 modification protein n=1 Tax=Shewanella gelidii TaxID=1642821 RepID=A0A917N7H0_9GAMM|nr:RimK/LysX family protein [Shewanella gelidii]MCL1097035.1 RimK/LysX family protein [Shewanella gelidii]GGI72059.1 ribosomal protein S6 modification protein [Shewanella gelidii]
MNRMIIGNLETCHLPDLGISDLHVRIDTGAQTSALHVDNLKQVKVNGKPYVEFDLHPDVYNLAEIVHCRAPLHDSRRIKSSNGEVEQRCVIKTNIQLGEQLWPIEITLSNRQDMTYLMLLGRQAMGERVYVDPASTYIVSSFIE